MSIKGTLVRKFVFDPDSKRSFLIRLKSLLDKNALSMQQVLDYMHREAHIPPIKRLMASSIRTTSTSGGYLATDWAKDDYFTLEESLFLVEAERKSERAGLVIAIDQIIKDIDKKVTFWSAVMEGRHMHFALLCISLGVILGVSQGQKEVFMKPLSMLGATTEGILIFEIGDFLAGPMLYLLIFLAFCSVGYIYLRNTRVSTYQREAYSKLGFFRLYDQLVEYKVVSTVGNFARLGINMRQTADSLLQIYNRPYERYRLNQVRTKIHAKRQSLIEALKDDIASKSTYSLLKIAASDEKTETISDACETTADELREVYLRKCRKLGIYLTAVSYSMFCIGIISVIDVGSSIQQKGQEYEARTLSRD